MFSTELMAYVRCYGGNCRLFSTISRVPEARANLRLAGRIPECAGDPLVVTGDPVTRDRRGRDRGGTARTGLLSLHKEGASRGGDAIMYGSHYLICAAIFAAVVAVSGCKRDLKVPEPKTAHAVSHVADSKPGWWLPHPAPQHPS